jgi:C4-dicarboxylate-specific signal transduction histidine kinase
MDNILSIISVIILAASIGILIYTFRLRRKLSKEILEQNENIKLKEAELKELRMMAAGVTHEINNAISIIIGRAEQVSRRNEDPTLERAVTNIKTTSDRIVTSVKGLRQFIYPDTKEVEEYIDLQNLMDDVLKLSGQRLKNHGIQLRLKGTEHKVIKGKKSQLEQLIINLLNQSVERLEGLEEKWIQLVAVEENGKINIYFSDFSSQVGDRITCKQFEEILENNHGHLTINQNNLVLELPKPDMGRYHS